MKVDMQRVRELFNKAFEEPTKEVLQEILELIIIADAESGEEVIDSAAVLGILLTINGSAGVLLDMPIWIQWAEKFRSRIDDKTIIENLKPRKNELLAQWGYEQSGDTLIKV